VKSVFTCAMTWGASDTSFALFAVLAAVVVIIVRIVGGKLDRQRICEHVEANGGKVIDILSQWFGGVGGRYVRTYDVTYTTRHGSRISATCITSMTSGVQWMSDRPPGSMSES
jgi:hypothetical protein